MQMAPYLILLTTIVILLYRYHLLALARKEAMGEIKKAIAVHLDREILGARGGDCPEREDMFQVYLRVVTENGPTFRPIVIDLFNIATWDPHEVTMTSEEADKIGGMIRGAVKKRNSSLPF